MINVCKGDNVCSVTDRKAEYLFIDKQRFAVVG